MVEGQLEGQTLGQFPKAVQRMWEKIEEEPQGLTLEEEEQQAQAEVMIGETNQLRMVQEEEMEAETPDEV